MPANFFIYILLLLLFTSKSVLADEYSPYAIYYSDKAPVSALLPYKMLILDSKHHPPLRPLIDRDKILLGYISLGEVENYRSYFSEVKKEGILLQENKDWPGSYYVDMRNQYWPRRVIEELIPPILRDGFEGLFFDTLDNPAELERVNPGKYKGMTQAAVHLVKAIRMHYPHIKIMMNRGYEILPQVANDIDMVLGESIYADYNFETKQNGFVEEGLYKLQVKMLQDAKKINPNLAIYTLDYWNTDDVEGISKIYAEQRKNGFIPYVATVKLDELIPEPVIQ